MIKRLKSKDSLEKERKRNNLILAIVLVGLMLFSSIGYAFLSKDSSQTSVTKKVGNLIFQQQGDYWALQLTDRILFFNYLPNEINNVDYNSNFTLPEYYNKEVYLVNADSNTDKIFSAFSGIVTRIQEACLEGEECLNENFPIKTCEDYIIKIDKTESLTDGLMRDKNCLIIRGNSTKVIDLMIYRLYGLA